MLVKGADLKNNYIHACSAFPVSDLHILLNYDQGEVVRKVKDMKKKERMEEIKWKQEIQKNTLMLMVNI